MKSFKSVVLSVVASLFLTVSLSGCLGDEKTASQSGSSESSVFDSGDVKLVLKPGSKYIMMHFPDRASAEKRSEDIRNAIQESGVIIERLVVSGDSSQGNLFVQFGQIDSKTALIFKKNSLVSIEVESVFGKIIALWEPSFGSDVKYTS